MDMLVLIEHNILLNPESRVRVDKNVRGILQSVDNNDIDLRQLKNALKETELFTEKELSNSRELTIRSRMAMIYRINRSTN